MGRLGNKFWITRGEAKKFLISKKHYSHWMSSITWEPLSLNVRLTSSCRLVLVGIVTRMLAS